MSGAFHRRLFRLRFTRSRPADLDDEFAFHIDMRARELQSQGMAADRAREEALRQFGDVDDARRYCRGEDERRLSGYRWSLRLDALRQDVTLALRGLRRRPAFAASTVLTLGVAIGIATIVFGVVHAYMLRPLPYPDADRLVHVIAGPSREPFRDAPSMQPLDWTTIDSIFAETVSWDLDGFTLPASAGGQGPEYVDGAWVSAGYFRALGMRIAHGRSFLPEEYRAPVPVAIISHALWRRRFGGDPGVIGRTIRAHSTDRPHDSEMVSIVGVMPADAWHVSRFTDVLRPLSTPRMRSIAKLHPGMTRHEAERRLNAIVLPQLGAVDPGWRMSLVSLQDEYTFRFRPALVAMLVAALFLLLIGGASLAGAQTARAAARRAELQVRAALGASRLRIAQQLLTESVLIAVLAALLGVTIAAVALGAIGVMVGEQLGADVPGGAARLSLAPVLLAASAFVGVGVGIASGMLPALIETGRAGGVTEIGATRGSLGRAATPFVRRGLVIAQSRSR